MAVIRPFVIGFATTLRHLFKKPITVNYPDQKFPMFPKFRGKQVLMRDENGLEKCVACGLCSVACPADAIYLEAAENDGSVQASEDEGGEVPDRFFGAELAQAAAGEAAADGKRQRGPFAHEQGREPQHAPDRRPGVGSGDEPRQKRSFHREVGGVVVQEQPAPVKSQPAQEDPPCPTRNRPCCKRRARSPCP